MKKYILFVLLVLSNFVYAEYIPMLSLERTWRTIELLNGETNIWNKLFIYDEHIVGDSIVEDKNYYVFQGYISGLLREDVAAQKVYYIPKDSTHEVLLYDFDVEVGDVVSVYNASAAEMMKYKVINVSDTDRKTIEVVQMIYYEDSNGELQYFGDDDVFFSQKWTSGIGGDHGVIFRYDNRLAGVYSLHQLLCVKDNGVVVYNTGEIRNYTNDCENFTNIHYLEPMSAHTWIFSGNNDEIIKYNTRDFKQIDGIDVKDGGYKQIMAKYNGSEVLLYDFSLEVGDQINTYAVNSDDKSTVISTDSITLLNGRRVKRIQYDKRADDIEFVGSVNGFLAPLMENYYENKNLHFCGVEYVLYSSHIEKVFSTNEEQCSDISYLSEIVAEDLFTINNDILMLKDVKCGSAAIYSADGRQVLSFTGNTADISSLPHGLYIVRAGAKTAKFVK